jgi:hypothetical protein
MKMVSRMQTTKVTWSADFVRSGSTYELLIVDEANGRTIIREPVALGDT